jgi:NAD(P)-dependent dehydrogenase (short-subunit alcohol dehydrogenase family)
MSHKNTLLFLGTGASVGAAPVAFFKSKGYRVASVAHTIRDEVAEHADLVLTADFSDPSAMQGVFDQVEERLGVPNVIVYNRESFRVCWFYQALRGIQSLRRKRSITLKPTTN